VVDRFDLCRTERDGLGDIAVAGHSRAVDRRDL
jgi:hypothetical protein